MAKPLKFLGKVAGLVATVAAFIPGGQLIAAVAAGVSALASTVGGLLTKPPPARGSITQVTIDPDPPQPYVMGRGYFAGVLRHDTGYGPTIDKVPNPYRFMAIVYSGAGPVQGIAPRVDFGSVPSWYTGFLYTDVQNGACPEADALSPQWAGAPGWGTSAKLSGQAAIGWSLKFDRKGERFANGLPIMGAEGDWVLAYDPRLDDTFPGGSGPHRLGDETTYSWTENPALHAGTYAFGRYQNGKRVIGVGLESEAIDWEAIAAWANVCDANGWTIFGVVWEGGQNGGSRQRWNNLREICLAGGGEPVLLSQLTFKYSAPVIPLDTIIEDDLTDGDQSVVAMQSYRERINTAIPKYTSQVHNWELVDAEPVVDADLLAEDGEEKRETWPFNMVRDKDQAAQLAAYRIRDSRELLITLQVKPRLRDYRPGECLTIDLPDLGLDQEAIILSREIDPETMEVTLEMISETDAKHAYCLGLTGVAPPTPALGQTAQERDQLASAAGGRLEEISLAIAGSYTVGLAGNITQVDNADGTWTVTIPNHTRRYGGVYPDVAITGDDLVIDESTFAIVSYDDETLSETDPTYIVTVPGVGGATAADAYASPTNPYRHFVGYVNTDAQGGSGGSTGGSGPSGSGGWDNNPDQNIP